MRESSTAGFTLMELLLTISIISLLASFTLSSLQGAKKQAQCLQIARQFIEMKKAFQRFRIEKNMSAWPGVYYFDSQVNDLPPKLNALVNKTDFGNYLTSVPEPPIGEFYDYRGTGFPHITLHNTPEGTAQCVSSAFEQNPDISITNEAGIQAHGPNVVDFIMLGPTETTNN